MSSLTYIIIIGIIAYIAIVNKDKILDFINKKKGKTQTENNFSQKELEEVRNSKIKELVSERDKLENQLEIETRGLRMKINEINLELAILEGERRC